MVKVRTDSSGSWLYLSNHTVESKDLQGLPTKMKTKETERENRPVERRVKAYQN